MQETKIDLHEKYSHQASLVPSVPMLFMALFQQHPLTCLFGFNLLAPY